MQVVAGISFATQLQRAPGSKDKNDGRNHVHSFYLCSGSQCMQPVSELTQLQRLLGAEGAAEHDIFKDFKRF